MIESNKKGASMVEEATRKELEAEESSNIIRETIKRESKAEKAGKNKEKKGV
jgi:hypothetical protein